MSTKLHGAGFTLDDDGLEQLAIFARRDDCLDAFVPSDIRQTVAELQRLRAALKPFAAFAEKAEAFVEARAKDGGSPILPSTDFRLSDFKRAASALSFERQTRGG